MIRRAICLIIIFIFITSVPLSHLLEISKDCLANAETMPIATTVPSEIELDGEFSDWVDKPNFDPDDNPNADDNSKFQYLAWFADPNDDNLYFYCQSDSTKKTWSIKVVFETDMGNFDAYVDYNSKNNNVSVELFKKGDNHAVWKNEGLWANTSTTNFTRLEFCVPMTKLVGDLRWGYLIRFRLLNGSGQAPKNSWFTLSTTSTFPWIGVGLSALVAFAYPFIRRRRKCTS